MASPRGLVQWLDQELHKSALLPRNARLLVAVSGGADSVALLRLLHAINGSNYWNWTLIVGHVDHGIRGRASAADAKFVAKLAKKLGLDFAHAKLKLEKRTSEDKARDGRLSALRQMVAWKKGTGVVMAHHADDQAETVLMRLMRGCGLKGLRGIEEKREILGLTIYRPLLAVRRAALHEYLQAAGQEWREDASNAADIYLRNRVRLDLMPAVEALAPTAVEAIGRLALLAGEAQELIEQQSKELIKRALKGGFRRRMIEKPKRPFTSGRLVFDRSMLRQAGPLMCGEVLRQAGASESFERLREAVRLVMGRVGGKRIEFGEGILVRVFGDKVIVERQRRDKRSKR